MCSDLIMVCEQKGFMQRPRNDKGRDAEEIPSVPKLGPLEMHIPISKPFDDG